MKAFLTYGSKALVPSLALALLVWALLVLGLSWSGSAVAKEYALTQGWEYRWGDSPFTDTGQPIWVNEKAPGAWNPITFPADPPNRDGKTNVWFRITLPDTDLRDPVLYMSSVDLMVEAYLDGKKIYSHGEFDENGQGQFSGWPWHMLTLPENYGGKTLYLRVFSDYVQIGVWGEVKVTDRLTLLQSLFEGSTEGLVAGGISLLIALLALTFALIQGQSRQFLWISLFCFASAGLILGDTPVNLLVYEHALFWNRMAAYAYILLPIPMFLLLVDWLSEAGVKVRHFRWLWQFHLLFFLGAVATSLLGITQINTLYLVFDGIFTVSLAILVVSVLFIFQRVRLDQRILIGAYLFLCSILMVDMAVAHNWLAWAEVPVSIGVLMFSLALVGLSLRHYVLTQQRLKELNSSLELKVNERTQQLEALAAKERLRSDKLLFQKEKSEAVSKIILSMESCHDIASALHSAAVHFEHLCQPLAGTFYHHDRGLWQEIQQWGQVIRSESLPYLDAIGVVKITDQRACYPVSLKHADGDTEVVAILVVELGKTAGQSEDEESLLELISSAIEKITFTLANISLREELQRYSYEDALTGLKNRRYFADMLKHEIATAERNSQPLSLLICDIDYFKYFNDAHGHGAGDQVLVTIAGLLKEQFRQSDVACRIGGEEFVVIMPKANADDCMARAKMLLQTVAATPIHYEGEVLESVTLSIGVASWPEQVDDPDSLMNMADNALYVAKSEGRNQIQKAVQN